MSVPSICPRCGGFVGPEESRCPNCGQQLAINPVLKFTMGIGAVIGAADGAVYGVICALNPASSFKGTVAGGLILGALCGALAGAILLGGVTYLIAKAVLTLLHGRDMGDDPFATEEQRQMRDWVVLWRANWREVMLITLVTMLILQAVVFGAYLYFG